MQEYNWMEMMEKMQEIRLFSSLYIRRARKGGISSAQELDMLSRVSFSKEPMTPQMLCSSMGISKPMVSRLIEHLEHKGFLIREKSLQDKRSYFIAVSSEGAAEVEQTYTYYLEPVYDLYRTLGGEEFSNFMELICRANQAVQNREKETER